MRFLTFLFAALAVSYAQTESDVVVFPNGDKLTGHFVKSNSSSVVFKSDALGELTIDWSKIKELRTAGKVAVIRKHVKVNRHANINDVPNGVLTADSTNLQVASAQAIPVKDTTAVVPQADFEKAVTRHPGITQDWKGAITFGATLVEATQNNRTFNSAVSLVRTEPAETWVNPRNRTMVNFSDAYGTLSQPGTPTVKTSIFHADAQRDEYFSPSVFAFGAGAFDHNYSQGLDLQQTYNGGIGWTAVNTSLATLNLKGSMSYVRQQFTTGPTQDLIGSVFSEDYTRKLPRGVLLAQKLSVSPAWNNTSAYTAAFSTLLTMPVFKRLSGSTGVIDNFLNDPPPGFKKNSFQFTLGLTYTIQ
jgi:hypothetical protein